MENNIEEKKELLAETVIDDAAKTVTEKKGKTPKIIAIVGVILVVLVLAVFGVMAANGSNDLFGSKVFANNGQRFFQLITTDQKILALAETNNKSSQVNREIKVDVDQIMNTLGEEDTAFGNFVLTGKEITKNEDFSILYNISLDGDEDAKLDLQIVKTGNLVGANIPGITDKFIGVDIGDTEGLVANLKELGLMEENSSNEDGYTEEQQQKIKDFIVKYLNLIAKDINDFVEKTPDKELNVNGKTINAKEYKIVLNGEAFTKVGVAVEKELLKNEKDIDLLVELGIIEDKDTFIEDLKGDIDYNKQIIAEKNYDVIFDEEIIFSVYEKNGKNIATVLEYNDVKIALYVLEESKDEYSIVFEISSDGDHIFLTYNSKENKGVKEGNMNLEMDIDNEEHKLDLCNIRTEVLPKVKDEMLTIKEEDMLLLNDASEEDIEDMEDKISKNLDNFLMKLLNQ